MTIQFACPACTKILEASEDKAGTYVNCSDCEAFVPVPFPQTKTVTNSRSADVPVSGDWFYAQKGQSVGPVSLTDLQSLAASGRLLPSDLVWKQGMAQRLRAIDVNELLVSFSFLLPPPLPPVIPAIPPPLPGERNHNNGSSTRGKPATRQRMTPGVILGLAGLFVFCCGCAFVFSEVFWLVFSSVHKNTKAEAQLDGKQKKEPLKSVVANSANAEPKRKQEEWKKSDDWKKDDWKNNAPKKEDRATGDNMEQHLAELNDALAEFGDRLRAARTLNDLRECKFALFKAARINRKARDYGAGDDAVHKAYDSLVSAYGNLESEYEEKARLAGSYNLRARSESQLEMAIEQDPWVQGYLTIHRAKQDLEQGWSEFLP